MAINHFRSGFVLVTLTEVSEAMDRHPADTGRRRAIQGYSTNPPRNPQTRARLIHILTIFLSTSFLYAKIFDILVLPNDIQLGARHLYIFTKKSISL